MSSPAYIAAFITGHSVRGCTGLSPVQQAFQRESGIPPAHWLPYNFPYHETAAFPPSVPLVTASLNNIGSYLGSRLPRFRRRHRAAVAARLACYDLVILLAGSCGLELLNNLDLPGDLLRRIHVFAYGPVSRRRPDTAGCMMVQGTRDLLSRSFHQHADHRYPCPHMGYLQAPETLVLFNAFCRPLLPGHPDAPCREEKSS